MDIQFIYDGEVYRNSRELYNKIKNDYLIRLFFYKGKQFIYDGELQTVLGNNEQSSESTGWLYIQGKTYSYYTPPQNLIDTHAELRQQWIQFVNAQNEERIDAELDTKIELVISAKLIDEVDSK